MRPSQNFLKNPRAAPTLSLGGTRMSTGELGQVLGLGSESCGGMVPQNRIKEWFWLEGTFKIIKSQKMLQLWGPAEPLDLSHPAPLQGEEEG